MERRSVADLISSPLHTSQLRPQESIPFLRRVSADLENLKDIKDKAARASMSSAGTSERAFERSYSVPTPVTSPLVTPETSSPNKFPSKPSDATLVGRKSQDTARRPASPRAATSPLPIPAAEEEFYDEAPVFREHRFVKSTFSKGQLVCLSQLAAALNLTRDLPRSCSRHLQSLRRAGQEERRLLRGLHPSLPRRLRQGRSPQLRSSRSDPRHHRYVPPSLFSSRVAQT